MKIIYDFVDKELTGLQNYKHIQDTIDLVNNYDYSVLDPVLINYSFITNVSRDIGNIRKTYVDFILYLLGISIDPFCTI